MILPFPHLEKKMTPTPNLGHYQQRGGKEEEEGYVSIYSVPPPSLPPTSVLWQRKGSLGKEVTHTPQFATRRRREYCPFKRKRVKKSIFPESGQNLCVTRHKWQNYPTFFALLFSSTTTILIALYYSKGSWTLDTSSSSSSFLLPLAITLFTATLGRLGTRGGGPPTAANIGRKCIPALEREKTRKRDLFRVLIKTLSGKRKIFLLFPLGWIMRK